MSEEFNWLDYAEPAESAPAPSPRTGFRRLMPRLPGRPRWLRLPRLPRLPRLSYRPSLPKLPRWRRAAPPAPAQPSATDLLTVRDERPLAELDDRLQLLRERSAAPAPPAAQARQALYDVDQVLAAPEFSHKPGAVISAGSLSKAQQQQVELLKDIVGGASQADAAGGRRFLPSLPLFSLSAVPRLIASAALLTVVSLPFVSSDFSQGELPPAEFDQDRPGPNTIFNLLDNLSEDDYVLVAFEYGPAAAGELDAIAELILRHIVAQAAKPLIVSSNPIAIVHAQNIISEINRSAAASGKRLQHGIDYYILRYLPGSSLGLRELSENFTDVARVSYKGALTGLEFDSLDELSLIVTIVERAEDMRNWAEQVVTELDQTRLLAASAYAAAPLAQVYADSLRQIAGLLVGYRDAYTYAEKLAASFGDLPPTPPNLEADLQPPAAQAEQPQNTAASQPPPATVTPLPNSGAIATNTALPTATQLPTATATLETIRVVEVTSPQQVRVRRGPTTVDDILQLARAGDSFEVLGTNGDGSWYNIALPNGLSAWIAQFLVEEKMLTLAQFRSLQGEASAPSPAERVFMRRESIVSLGKIGPRYYQANTPLRGEAPEYALMRDRSQEAPRLEAMTFGTVAAIVLIALGNVIYALGALGRRRPAVDTG